MRLILLLMSAAALVASVVPGFPSAHAGQVGSAPESGDSRRLEIEEMIQNVEREARAGNPQAQYVYGTLFGEDGAAEAARWFRRAADQGHAKAQAALGASYLEGAGVPKDEAEAARWFRRAADQGEADAQYVLGALYAQGRGVARDDAEAARWYRRAADLGHADAQYQLARLYVTGTGVPRDDRQAVVWLERAGSSGNPFAQYLLGHMYRDGRGVPRDAAASAAWFRKAADKDMVSAQVELARMLEDGDGVPRDEAEATRLYRAAAERGHPEAQYRLSKRLEPRLSRQEVLERLAPRPAGKPDARPSAAESAEVRARRERQAAESETWLRRAAEAGYPDAWHDLAERETDKVEALKWLYLLANHPDPPPDASFGIFPRIRDLERALGPEGTARARRLAAEWEPRRAGATPQGRRR